MLPKEIVQKIRRIQITTNRLVNESLAGEYRSVFKGRGMEFDQFATMLQAAVFGLGAALMPLYLVARDIAEFLQTI